jgi:phage shock protein PspC (stress-responsive transcriptional regulator)
MNATTSNPAADQDLHNDTGPSDTGPSGTGPSDTGTGARQRLQRPLHDRMVAGVAAGIADYLDVDPTIVRIVLAALTLAGGAGVAVYIAGWLLIPEEGSGQSLADDFIGGRAR